MKNEENQTVVVGDLATSQDPQGGANALSSLTATSASLQAFSVLRLRSAGSGPYDIWRANLSTLASIR